MPLPFITGVTFTIVVGSLHTQGEEIIQGLLCQDRGILGVISEFCLLHCIFITSKRMLRI